MVGHDVAVVHIRRPVLPRRTLETIVRTWCRLVVVGDLVKLLEAGEFFLDYEDLITRRRVFFVHAGDFIALFRLSKILCLRQRRCIFLNHCSIVQIMLRKYFAVRFLYTVGTILSILAELFAGDAQIASLGNLDLPILGVDDICNLKRLILSQITVLKHGLINQNLLAARLSTRLPRLLPLVNLHTLLCLPLRFDKADVIVHKQAADI